MQEKRKMIKRGAKKVCDQFSEADTFTAGILSELVIFMLLTCYISAGLEFGIRGVYKIHIILSNLCNASFIIVENLVPSNIISASYAMSCP